MSKKNNIFIERDVESERVNKAWSRLKTKLGEEGLLNSAEESESVMFEINKDERIKGWKFAYSGIAASFLILLTVSILFFKSIYSVKSDKMVLENIEANSTYVTTLEDGSTVYLAGNTTLSKPKNFGKLRRVTQLEGDAFFDIARNTSRPFVIETSLAKIEVLGTSFSVNENMVNVKSGKVRVWLKNGGSSATIEAGEAVFFEQGKLRTVSGIQSDSLFTRYTGRMHFKDEKLINVINVINKKSAANVRLLLDNGLENRVITATFSDENRESYAKLICIALDLKYDVSKSEIRIHR